MRKISKFSIPALLLPLAYNATAEDVPVINGYSESEIYYATESGGELEKANTDSLPSANEFKFKKTDKYGDFVLMDSEGILYYLDPIYLDYEMEQVELSVYCPETDENRAAAVTRGVDSCE